MASPRRRHPPARIFALTTCTVLGVLVGLVVALDNQPVAPDCNVHPCEADNISELWLPIFLPIAIGAIGGLLVGALIATWIPPLARRTVRFAREARPRRVDRRAR